LSQLGLNDQEIAVLAFVIEGYSSRRVAKFIGRSQTFVRKARLSAETKLRRSGLRATKTKFPPENQQFVLRIRTVDPAKLEAMALRKI
jgi:transposase